MADENQDLCVCSLVMSSVPVVAGRLKGRSAVDEHV
jgi:hypothetical protein